MDITLGRQSPISLHWRGLKQDTGGCLITHQPCFSELLNTLIPGEKKAGLACCLDEHFISHVQAEF